MRAATGQKVSKLSLYLDNNLDNMILSHFGHSRSTVDFALLVNSFQHLTD